MRLESCSTQTLWDDIVVSVVIAARLVVTEVCFNTSAGEIHGAAVNPCINYMTYAADIKVDIG